MAEGYFRRGVAFAQRAINEDKNRRYEEAAKLYKSAIDEFMMCERLENNELAKDTVRMRAVEYQRRVADISKALKVDIGSSASTGKDKAEELRAFALYLDGVHCFDKALDTYTLSLSCFAAYMSETSSHNLKPTFEKLLRRAEFIKQQKKSGDIKKMLEFPYMHKQRIQSPSVIRINMLIDVLDPSFAWRRGTALFDTGNGGATLMQTSFAKRLGLLKDDGSPVVAIEGQTMKVQGVVPGASKEVPLIPVRYRVNGAEIVTHNIGIIDLPEDKAWDLLICLKEIQLLEKHGVMLSSQAA